MSHKGPKNPERSFGISVGSVLLLIGAYALWRGRMTGATAFASIGLMLLVLGLTRPALLKWPSAVWWKIAMVLGWFNARLILTLAFVLLFVPISIAWRLLGKDPLQIQRKSWSGWTPYPDRYRDRSHFSRMY